MCISYYLSERFLKIQYCLYIYLSVNNFLSQLKAVLIFSTSLLKIDLTHMFNGL
jgi:hypothetical protein